jgi:exonuclease VII small subunit
MKQKSGNLTQTLSDLRTIVEWFEHGGEIDVEEGLKKVKEAAVLLRESKDRLKEIENEFEEVKKEMSRDE